MLQRLVVWRTALNLCLLLLPDIHLPIQHLNEIVDYVVAIDLGTSRTAYSWKSALDPNPPVGVPDMGPNDDIVGKSPTSILLGGITADDKRFKSSGALAYGRVAQRRYAENDIPHGAQLFKRFKMVSIIPVYRVGITGDEPRTNHQ